MVGEWDINRQSPQKSVQVHSVIPRRALVKLSPDQAFSAGNYIYEVSEYALEMDENREVTDRDDIILDQKGLPINAQVTEYIPISHEGATQHIVLF